MDDDEERDFSRTIVFGFMEQAEQSFKDMEDSLYVFLNPSYPPERKHIHFC